MDPKIPLELPEAPEKAVWDAEEFKIVARYRKARKLAAVLLDTGMPVAQAIDLADNDKVRVMTTAIARVNESSDITWALVKEMLREAL